MIDAKVISENTDRNNYVRVKADVKLEGKRSVIVQELYALLKAIEKENCLELILAIEKIMEDKNNEEA